MGIFGKKEAAAGAPKNAQKDIPKKKTGKKAPEHAGRGLERDLSRVLEKPYITEKAVLASEKNVYVFEVSRDATKFDIRDAVKKFFNVTPIKIRTVIRQPRQFMSRARGRKMTAKGQKKAYVYVKEGDRIDIV